MGNQSRLGSNHLIFNNSNTKSDSNVVLKFGNDPSLEEIEEKYLRMILAKYAGHRGKTAQILVVSERTLYRLIKEYPDLSIDSF